MAFMKRTSGPPIGLKMLNLTVVQKSDIVAVSYRLHTKFTKYDKNICPYLS